jgi:hypothetical protein
VTISNPTKQDIVLTNAIYDVSQTGEVKGGTAGPLNSQKTYRHVIVHETGKQSKQLVPPFSIPRESAASLELVIASLSQGKGLGWLLRIGFVSGAEIFYTEQFQLYLPESSGEIVAPSTPVPLNNQSSRDLASLPGRFTIPDRSYRECIFTRAKVAGIVTKLDELDRDFLFARAKVYPLDEFPNLMTETNPPILYGDLLQSDQIKTLLTLIKSGVPCKADR